MPQADHGRLFLRTQSCLASYFVCFYLAFYFLWDYGILSLFWFWVVFPDSAVCILDLYLEAQSAKTKATNQQVTIKPKHTTKRSSEMLGSGISRILSFWFLKRILLNAPEPISFIVHSFCHKYSDFNALIPVGDLRHAPLWRPCGKQLHPAGFEWRGQKSFHRASKDLCNRLSHFMWCHYKWRQYHSWTFLVGFTS